MSLKGLECPVSNLVNSDARPRPTTSAQQAVDAQVNIGGRGSAVTLRITAACAAIASLMSAPCAAGVVKLVSSRLPPGAEVIATPCIFPQRFSKEHIQGRVSMTAAPGA
jgi:hypothetical protein